MELLRDCLDRSNSLQVLDVSNNQEVDRSSGDAEELQYFKFGKVKQALAQLVKKAKAMKWVDHSAFSLVKEAV
jgi:hypothetical protein